MPEPPYGEIADLLKAGQVIPFLGAGVNFGTHPAGGLWDDKTFTFLPSGAELARFLAAKSNFPSKDEHDLTDLARVASYFVDTSASPPAARPIGSGARNLTHADSDEDAPSVSPDGNWIAFTRYTAKGRTDVFMMPIEGGEAMLLTTGEADDSAPVWVWPK